MHSLHTRQLTREWGPGKISTLQQIPPVSRIIDISRTHLSQAIKTFIHNVDELLEDIAHHQKAHGDIRTIIEFRRLLQFKQDYIIFETVTLFVSSFIATERHTNTTGSDNTCNDAYLNSMITALRDKHATQLRTIEDLFPRMTGLHNNGGGSNPFDPVDIHVIACNVLATLEIEETRKTFCMRELHYALRDKLTIFYNDIIGVLSD